MSCPVIHAASNEDQGIQRLLHAQCPQHEKKDENHLNGSNSSGRIPLERQPEGDGTVKGYEYSFFIIKKIF